MANAGGCRCGAIRYEVAGTPAHSTLCWCDACRGSAGAPVVVWALFPRADVRVTGTPVAYESSPDTIRQFCGTCGTGLFYVNEAIFPGQIDIQAATLDDPDAFPPQAQIQVADAPKWMAGMAELPRFAGYPGGA